MKSFVVLLALALLGPFARPAQAQVFRGDSLTRKRPVAAAKPAKARPARAKPAARPAPRKAAAARPAPKQDEVIVIIEDP